MGNKATAVLRAIEIGSSGDTRASTSLHQAGPAPAYMQAESFVGAVARTLNVNDEIIIQGQVAPDTDRVVVRLSEEAGGRGVGWQAELPAAVGGAADIVPGGEMEVVVGMGEGEVTVYVNGNYSAEGSAALTQPLQRLNYVQVRGAAVTALTHKFA